MYHGIGDMVGVPPSGHQTCDTSTPPSPWTLELFKLVHLRPYPPPCHPLTPLLLASIYLVVATETRTVGKQVVRILLEFFLVHSNVWRLISNCRHGEKGRKCLHPVPTLIMTMTIRTIQVKTETSRLCHAYNHRSCDFRPWPCDHHTQHPSIMIIIVIRVFKDNAQAIRCAPVIKMTNVWSLDWNYLYDSD